MLRKFHAGLAKEDLGNKACLALAFILSSSRDNFEDNKSNKQAESTYTKQRSKLLDLRFAARPSSSQGATDVKRKDTGHRSSISQDEI